MRAVTMHETGPAAGHRAEQIADRRLRIARVRCPQCGFERDVFFVLEQSGDN